MGTKQEDAEMREEKEAKAEVKREEKEAKAEARREVEVANVENLEAQLKAYSTQLNDLIAGYLRAESQPNDAYRVRIDAMRAQLGVVETKLNEYKNPPAPIESWRTFHAAIKGDLADIENGLKDLTQ